MPKIFKSICLMVVMALVLSLVSTLVLAIPAAADDFEYETPTSATASTEYPGYPASNAIDGSTVPEYSWFSDGEASSPQWIYFDLGEIKCIDAVKLVIYYSDVPLTMDVQVSDDASDWTTVADDWTVTSGSDWDNVYWVGKNFSETNGRYIRLYQTSYNRTYGTCTEFQASTAEICEPPTARISASALMGDAPLEVQFRGYSDQSDVEYRWSFGTGDRSHSRSPSYTFYNEGTFTVTLTVTNECGESARDSVTINVEAQNLPPVLVVRDLNISPAYAKYGEPVYITATVFNEGGSWGSQDMQLLINGQFEQSAPVGLAAGTGQPISFTVYKTQAREYQVTIGDATGTFYVMEEAAQPTQRAGLLAGGELDTGGIIAIICIAVILVGGVVVVFLFSRRSS